MDMYLWINLHYCLTESLGTISSLLEPYLCPLIYRQLPILKPAEAQFLTQLLGGKGLKLLSCSQCQELGQRVNLASDWLPENKEPIRSQDSSLTQLLT